MYSSRTGSMDDPERGTVAFYMSPGPMSLIFEQNTPTATSIKHAGFKAILKPFGKQSHTFLNTFLIVMELHAMILHISIRS